MTATLFELAYKLITHYESLHDGDLKVIGLQPKMDPVGIWTEGWGHAIINPATGKFVRGADNKSLAYKLHKVNTKEEADKVFHDDIQPILLNIERKYRSDLFDQEKAAIASHTFNTGGSDTLRKLINSKSDLLGDWWKNHYITADGIEMKGLIYRRETEFVLYSTDKLIFKN